MPEPLRKTSFRSLLAAQFVAVLPVLCFAAWVAGRDGVLLQSQAEKELQRQVVVAADAIAREAEGARTAARVMAVQEDAQEGNVAAIKQLAVTLTKTAPTLAYASAFDRNGRVVFATHLADGQEAPREMLSAGARALFDLGSEYVSGLTSDGGDKESTVGIAVPWRVRGVTTYALRVSIKPVALGAVLRKQQWPEQWTAALLDQHMVIMGRSRDEHKYTGTRATPSLKALIQEGVSGISYSRTQEGTVVATALALVPGTPWWVVAGMPRSTLNEGVIAPIKLLLIGGLVTMAVSISASVALMYYLNSRPKRSKKRENLK